MGAVCTLHVDLQRCGIASAADGERVRSVVEEHIQRDDDKAKASAQVPAAGADCASSFSCGLPHADRASMSDERLPAKLEASRGRW